MKSILIVGRNKPLKADLKRIKSEYRTAQKLLDTVKKDAVGEQHAIENLESELKKRKHRQHELADRMKHLYTIVVNFEALVKIEDQIENEEG